MEKKTVIPIMTCFDKNYVIPAAVAFYSLLENASQEYFYKIYVLHTDISINLQEKLTKNISEFSSFASIEFINMENKFDDIWNKIYKGGHFSKEVMYKILVASIFPQYEKLVITDVDVVFLGDISSSYIDFDTAEEHYVAGIKPIGKLKSYYENSYKTSWTDEEIKKLGHICGGYLIANLKKIRKENMEEKFIDCFIKNGHRLNQMEQDVLNICCYPKIKYLPLEYVACTYMWDYYKNENDMKKDETYTEKEIKYAMENPIQLHYATRIKPWKNVDCTKSEEWFQYVTKTNFLTEYLQSLPEKIISTTVELEMLNKVNENILKRVINYIKKNPLFFLKSNFYYKLLAKLRKKLKFFRRKEIIYICDDVFPSKLSSFRYEEFLGYWNSFSDVQVLTSDKNLKHIGENKNFDELILDFNNQNRKSHHKITIYPFIDSISQQNFEMKVNEYRKKIAVLDFLNNLINDNNGYLELLEKYQIPFVFTLYPGGGFALDNKETNDKLQRVFNSKMFKKVIVTQEVVRNYLLKNSFCKSDKIEVIYGVVVPNNLLLTEIPDKKYFFENKETLDICFVAYKYMKEGKDKGYDIFIETAKELCKKYKNIKFHVVGTFNESDIDISEIKENITFYGPQTTEWFSEFYKDKDILLSPNRSNQLTKGAFDGFPTGTAVEAMLHKVMLLATDELRQNILFKDKKDLVLIKPEVSDIVNKVEYYYNNPKEIKEVSNSGYNVVKENYSYEKQVVARINILKEELEKM